MFSVLSLAVAGLVMLEAQPLQATGWSVSASWQTTQRWVSSLVPAKIQSAALVRARLDAPRLEQSGSAGTLAPTVSTDKADYHPGDTVIVTGTGWLAGSTVELVFHETVVPPNHPDEHLFTVVDGNGTIDTSRPNTPADDYLLEAHDLGVEYLLTAKGSASDGSPAEVSTTFLDTAIGTYDQCSNDTGTGYTTGDTGCRWINGNLQSNNSRYAEGDATVQRLWLTDLVPGSTHTITLKYGTTKQGKHAYDFLTTWDWSESWITAADLCQDITGCLGSVVQSTLDIPQDPNVPNSFEPSAPGDRLFVMRGGTLTGATTPAVVSGSYAGDSETVTTVSFTVGNTGDMCATKQGTTTCGVALWFGAHVAAQANWGTNQGAGSIPGSPYHVALDQLDGASVGQRDNQMQANAVTVIPNGTIVVVKDAIPDDAQDFNFNLTNNDTINQNFSLDDDTDPTLLNTQTFSVPPGIWQVAELTLPSGWNFFSLLCTGGTGTISYGNPNAQTATVQLKSNETVTCTYTNTKQLGGLKLLKTLSNADGATVPTSFTIDYNCGTGFTGSVSVAPAGFQTVSNIPTGTTCNISEPALTPIPGFTWGTPVISATSVVIGEGTTVEVTVANSITRDVGGLQIVKTLSNPDGATVPASFAVNYDCGVGYTGQVNVSPGSPQTVSGIPTGRTCTVTEVAPAAIPGYTWGTITYTPSSVDISTSGGTFTITVGNSITRDQGYLKISKTFNPLTSGFNGTFAVVYNCGAGNVTVNLAAGGSTTVGPFATGTSCTVSEPTLPSAPTGWTFGTPSVSGSPATIVKGDQAAAVTVTVTNTISRDQGYLKLSKVFDPKTSGFGGTFAVVYNCGAGDQTVNLSAGGSTTVGPFDTGTN
jgi:hypothetical protein